VTEGPQVPSYVLDKILYYLCSDGPLPLRHVLFVSKAFFYAATNNAQLWTTISIDAAFINHFEGRSAQHASRFVKQCLLQSGELPLCLRIIYPIHPRMAILRGSLQTLINPKYRGAERCTSLMLQGNRYSSISRILALLPKELVSLRHLSLFHFGDPAGVSQFPNCPLLERVEIWGHLNPSPTLWGTHFAHITTLSFGNKSVWSQYDMGIFLLFPLLHDLTLSTTHYPGEPGSGLPVQFEYLRILGVHGTIPREILTRVVAPALEELHIEANSLHLTSIDELVISFKPLYLRLYALLPEGISVGDPMWATPFSELVEKCTRLEALYISKWMEEKCKRFTKLVEKCTGLETRYIFKWMEEPTQEIHRSL
jgi:hypothetical protein